MKEKKKSILEEIFINFFIILVFIIFGVLIVGTPTLMVLSTMDVYEKNDYCESLGYDYYETKILNRGSTNTKQYINCYTESFNGNDFVIRESGWRLYE